MAVNQLKAGAILNYVIIGLNATLGLLYTPYMLHMLGQNEYGLYSIVASLIAYLTILDFGFGNAIVRYTAKFIAERKAQKQHEMFGMFVIIYSLIGIIAFTGGLILYFNVDRMFDATMTESDISQARTMMMLLTINLAFTFPLSIFGSIITAYEDFVFQRVVNILRILISTAVMVVLLSYGFKAIALVVVQTAFNMLTLAVNAFYCFSKLNIRIVFRRFDPPFLKEIGTYSFWIFLNAIMDKIYWGTGQFVLGAISGTVAVAIFSVAILLQQMYMTFSTAICSVLLPRITAMVATNRSDQELSDLFIKTGRVQCIVMALILGGFIAFGDGFIHIWAGKEYSASYLITLIFFCALFIPLIQNTGISILQARNQMKFRSLLYLGVSMTSLVLQIFLSKALGATGCAIAIGGALILGQGIIMNIYYYKVQQINIPRFWIEIARMLLPIVPIVFIGYVSSKYFDYSLPAHLAGGIFIFIVLYMLAVWNWSMNKYERNLIASPIRNLKSRLIRHND